MAKSSGQIRIIAGQWRGRRLPVRDVAGLRPTTDRQKETLFNWLQGSLDGAHILDLYAGAGGLGFEAMSRYGASLVAVERDKQVVQQLKANAGLLKSDAIEVVCADVLDFLKGASRRFDVVFIDPPFRKALVAPTLALLKPWLADDAWIYMEAEAELPMPLLPADFELYRDKVAGQSHGYLYQFERTAN
ncbi:16S rRNA (guanine(966)-N(2))-methyltransferase RsmD [Echinimonas agarilytica]|uniref:Ribosomal RNA small subunit methyltransferase D n=1 Tax=Echinimonas agarilytica TaxID=1215918 RepID=A0AA41W8L3_9GAMM|nr:16S rRNA (guanine(966)-N(2))-methyltransferase RsmD [Echinimonas agarilytica]MCM2681034.1 16S rRNA (guanine(966)-N(2))-methyltransferase RsmD [Echinimonas agarilytica]